MRWVSRTIHLMPCLCAAAAMCFALGPARAQNLPDFPPPDLILELRSQQDRQFPGGAALLPNFEQLRWVQVSSEVRALVNQLEHPSFEVREQASRTLIESAPDKMQLYAILVQDGSLSAEQRYRILHALRESLVRTPRGALGISMQPMPMNELGQIEIRVTDLLPGLPAERVLKVGDRIIQVDDRPLTAFDDLQFRVQSKKPGETVSLTVRRAQLNAEGQEVLDDNNAPAVQTIRIELELGSAELLRSFNAQLNVMNQGVVQPPGRVEILRREEARAAEARLAPKPREITIDGQSTLVVDNRLPAGESQPDALDLEIDDHPLVQQITRQKQQIVQGVHRADQIRILEDLWQRQLMDLYRQSQEPGLTQGQRDHLSRLINRVERLLAQ